MAILVRDYLEREGYYHAPPAYGHHPSTSDVKEQDIILLAPEWKPEAARFDPTMVDELIGVFRDFQGGAVLPGEIDEKYFSIKRFEQQSKRKLEYEAEVRNLVSATFLTSLFFINERLGHSFIVQEEGEPTKDARSRVDIVLEDDLEKRALLELKNPIVFSEAKQLLRGSFEIHLASGALSAGRKVINKLALYMASYHARWAALTCHNEWIFFRLHKATEQNQPYLSYSSAVSLLPVAGQDDRTKPLQAFLGMLVATANDVDVVSGADLRERLEPIPEDEYEVTDDDDSADEPARDNSDESYHPPEGFSDEGSPGSSEEGASERPSRSHAPRHRNHYGIPDILVGWSLDVTPANKWLKLYAASDAKHMSLSLDFKPARFRLQRVIGAGSTGCVYEAKFVDSTQEIRPDGRTYAMKLVSKGTVGEERGRITRLFEEFKIYTAIEEARERGKPISAVPRCYGLYETKHTLALVLDYAGESLPGVGWEELKASERKNIFKAVKEIHELGISHNDLHPRNIVHASDGTFKIIDFTASKLHRCRGIGKANGIKRNPKRGSGCSELRWIRGELMSPSISLSTEIPHS